VTSAIENIDNTKLLLSKIKAGDQYAFEKIYRLYSLRIYYNILKIVKSEEAAKEILQEVFIKIWEKREQIDLEQSFTSYLFQISKHMVYSALRKENVEKKLKDYLSFIGTEIYTHVEEALAYKHSEKFVLESIEKLPPQRKQVYTLCKIEGKSYEEVSRILGISTSTISDHIVKATKFIKNQRSFIDGSLAIIITEAIFKVH